MSITTPPQTPAGKLTVPSIFGPFSSDEGSGHLTAIAGGTKAFAGTVKQEHGADGVSLFPNTDLCLPHMLRIS